MCDFTDSFYDQIALLWCVFPGCVYIVCYFTVHSWSDHVRVAMANREKISQFRAATKTDLPTAQSILAGEYNWTVTVHTALHCNL